MSAATLSLLALTCLSATAQAQAVPKAKDARPAAADVRPLARYLPKDNLLFLIETNGLDSNPEGWKKTAAYRMLNDTSLGAMLEAMLTQLADRALGLTTAPKLSGADVATLVKHIAKQGFAVGGVADDKGDKPVGHLVVVFRGSYSSRENRPAFGRLMGTLMGANRAISTKKGGRTVVQVTRPTEAAPAWVKGLGPTWVWWPEQGDLVLGLGQMEDADVVIAALEGKTPNAVEHPLRAELMKENAGYSPIGVMFLDPVMTQKTKPDQVHSMERDFASAGIKRFDLSWGFHDEALMSVARLKAPKPRKGLLALFDQPLFDRTKLPPIPESLESFTAFSVDTNMALDTLLAAAPALSPAAAKIGEHLGEIESKSRVDLRKDVLSKIGPKMVVYVMPGTTVARSPEAETKGSANPLSALIGLPLPGMASATVPRYTLVGELKDSEAFGKSLDSLMVAINKELKTKAADAAKAIEDAAKVAGGPGARAGRPGGAPGDRRPPAASAPEFKLMTGNEKVYVLTMPPDQVKMMPAGFRPTIRVGAKYVAIAATPDAARLALEAKADAWSAPADLAVALDRLPKELLYLAVHDPRATQPETLATLPGTIQRLVNAAFTNTPSTTNPTSPGGPPGMIPPNGLPGMAGMGNDEKRGRGNRGGPAARADRESWEPRQGRTSSGTGGPGDSSPGAAKPGAKPTAFAFDIAPNLLPSADDLKSTLFPNTFAVFVNDQDIVFQNRGAFPNPASAEFLNGAAFGIPFGKALQKGTMPPGLPGSGIPGAPPGAGTAGRRPGGGGGGNRADQ